MTLDDFIPTYTGKFVEFDGKYPNQCVDLIKLYNRDVIGAPQIMGNAIDYQNNPLPTFYTYEKNTLLYIPPRGAIAVFNEKWGNGLGHTGIVTKAWIMKLTLFEQNNPVGNPCTEIVHNYLQILGFLVPKEQKDDDKYNQLVDELRSIVNRYPKL